MFNNFKFSQRLFCYFINTRSQSLLNTVRPFILVNRFSQVTCISFEESDLFTKNNPTRLIPCRFKSKRKNKKVSKYDEDSDEEDEDFENEVDGPLGKGIEEKTYSVETMRVDAILKMTLGLNRKKIETSFYENRIRVNGRIIMKKSINAKAGDVLDIIKDIADENPEFLTVSRVEILGVKVDSEEEKLLVKVRKSKSLLIDNYPDGDSWHSKIPVTENQ